MTNKSYTTKMIGGRYVPYSTPDLARTQTGMTIRDARREANHLNRQPAQPKQRTPGWTEITSGLGIGGHGSDDYNMATERDNDNAPQFGRYGGQLWQECDVPGCHNEPVCATCLRCEKTHCHCQ